MKVVYISNFFNHHQSALADAFYRSTEGNYWFIEMMEMPAEQINLGYPQFNRPFLVKYFETPEYADRLISEADVVIHGEAPVSLIRKRLQRGQLTFHDNERRYKCWVKYLKWPIYTYNSLTLNKGYLLCASAFASRDFGLSGMAEKKCFRWGYFTKVEELKNRKYQTDDVVSIMWCSRFIYLKHPELPIKLAAILKVKGYRFKLDLFGDGNKLQATKSLANKLKVDDVVTFHGSRQNDEILKEMRNHDIFLFTSDQNEGWGAVLNESMSSGCAVVASHDIGAVPYLIKDGVNGMIYKSCDVNSLAEKTMFLMDNAAERIRMGKEAYRTMSETWNAEIASRNLLRLAESLLKNEKFIISDGPCSPSPRCNHR